MVDEVRSTELAIISSYQTRVSAIIVTLDKNISNYVLYRYRVSVILSENVPKC